MKRHHIAALPLLLIMFALALGSMQHKSPTFDEGFYIGRGYAFLTEGRLFTLGHPPLTNVLAGLGVILEPNLPDPTTLAGWEEGNPETFSEALLWESGINTTRVTYLARMPVILLGVLLGAVVYRWAHDLYDPRAAALALGLYALSPSVLAHTRLATTDLGVAAFFVAMLYAWWRYLERQTVPWFAASGLLFGLAQASKFSALLLLPTLGLVTAAASYRRGGLRVGGWRPGGWFGSAVVILTAMAGVGAISLWAAHVFSLRPLAEGMYPRELLHFLGLAAEGHRGYLLGRFAENGWWYYHLVALGVKLTEPALLLIVGGVISAVAVQRMRPAEWVVVFPVLLYLGVTLLLSLNVGVRYLLPIIPLMFIFAARLAERVPGWALGGLWAAHAVIALAAYPHYIAYFNLASGGPQNGHHILADSNLDWGQDLPLLADYLTEHDIDSVHLSYFGQADPAYYGIAYEPLPAWPPPPPGTEFAPLNPEPGVYAISASNLVGVQLFEPDSFGAFRGREPFAAVGHSIRLYEVPSRPPLERVSLCAEGPILSEQAVTALHGGTPEIAYVDCANSLLVPGWVVLPSGAEPVGASGTLPDFLGRDETGAPLYRAWRFDEAPPPAAATNGPTAGEALTLVGYTLSDDTPAPGETFTVTAWWRIETPPPPPVSILAHLLTPEGSLLVAADALGVPLTVWEPGAVIVQQHTFTVPPDAASGAYSVALGLYRLDTGERYPLRGEGDASLPVTIQE